MMKKVIATKRGFKDGVIREAGDIFEVSIDAKSKWYKNYEDGQASVSDPADSNSDGSLSKAEILKWFEDNAIDVDASLGVAALRKAYAAAKESK